jgi:hypothetical protein
MHTHAHAAGTIMQNTYEELFVVLNLLSPGCLGMYGAFVEYYSKCARVWSVAVQPPQTTAPCSSVRSDELHTARVVTCSAVHAMLRAHMPQVTRHCAVLRAGPSSADRAPQLVGMRSQRCACTVWLHQHRRQRCISFPTAGPSARAQLVCAPWLEHEHQP